MTFLLRFLNILRPKICNELNNLNKRDVGVEIEIITLPSGKQITLVHKQDDEVFEQMEAEKSEQEEGRYCFSRDGPFFVRLAA